MIPGHILTRLDRGGLILILFDEARLAYPDGGRDARCRSTHLRNGESPVEVQEFRDSCGRRSRRLDDFNRSFFDKIMRLVGPKVLLALLRTGETLCGLLGHLHVVALSRGFSC